MSVAYLKYKDIYICKKKKKSKKKLNYVIIILKLFL